MLINRSTCLLPFLLLIVETVPAQEVTCPPGLVGYWNLDETAAPFADAFGGRNATCTACPTSTPGKVLNAQAFSGAAGRTNLAVAPDAAFSWGADTSFSLELWVRTTTTALQIFMARAEGDESGFQVWLGISNGRARFYVQDAAGSRIDLLGLTSINDGEWHHIAGVRDAEGATPAERQVRLYVDAVLQGQASETNTLPLGLPFGDFDGAATHGITFGWIDLNVGGFYLDGSLDDIAVHNDVLPATGAGSIAAHYNSGAGASVCEGASDPTPPSIQPIPDFDAVVAGSEFTYDVVATGNPQPDAFSLLLAPAGMTINPLTGRIEWQPSELDIGTHDVTVEAANGQPPAATDSFTVTVLEAPDCVAAPTSYWPLDEIAAPYADFTGIQDADCTICPVPVSTPLGGGQDLGNAPAEPRLRVQATSAYNWGASTSFALEAWIRTLDGTLQIIVGRTATSGTGTQVWIGVTDGKARFFVRDELGATRNLQGATDINDDEWHHVVGVRDATPGNKRLRLFVDGTEDVAPLAENGDFFGTFDDSSEYDLTFGWIDLDAGDFSFNGTVDEVAVYGRLLEPAEIMEHHQSGLAGTPICEIDGCDAPEISSLPATVQLTEGEPLALSITPDTFAFSYQWFKGGVAIPEATSASYSIAATVAADSGSYFVEVTDESNDCTARSNTAVVTVTPLGGITITEQPMDLIVLAPAAAEFSVGATGPGTLSYQWQRKVGALDFANIDSATNPSAATDTLVIDPTTAADDETFYRCVITNGADTAISDAAILIVNTTAEELVIVTQPVDRTVEAPQAASFSVAASGPDVLLYQWQRQDEEGGEFIDIDPAQNPSAATATLSIAPTSIADNGARFRAVVSSGAQAVTSNAALLIVLEPGEERLPALALYTFQEGSGADVFDQSGVAPALDLKVLDPLAVTWTNSLRINSPTAIASAGPATKIISAVEASQELTVEAWITPAALNAEGPDRIVALSENPFPDGGNFVLGQALGDFVGRNRTTTTNQYGVPACETVNNPLTTTEAQQIAYTRDSDGVVRLYHNGMLLEECSVPGPLAWDPGYRLTLGNEPLGGRAWLGTFHLVAFYDAALTAEEVETNFLAGPGSGGFNQAPSASFVSSPSAGNPLEIAFDASASTDADGTIVSYDWSFGDGMEGSGQLVNHTYATDGSFAVTLEVTDDKGARNSTTTIIAVGSPPVETRVPDPVVLYAFRAEGGSLVSDVADGDDPLDLEIADPAAVTWLPQCGLTVADVTTITSAGAAAKVNEAVQASGELTVELWVQSASLAQEGPARVFSISENPFPAGGNFVFGQDGDELEARNRTTATNQYGQPACETFTGPLTTGFHQIAYTRDATGTVQLYRDGAFLRNCNVEGAIDWNPAYALSLANEPTGDRPWLGTFYLVAVYDRALSAEEVARNHRVGNCPDLDAPPVNVPPVAVASADPLTGASPLEVAFDASLSSDSDGVISSYGWEFGDGESAAGAMVTHTFAAAGTYVATLTVTDDDGDSSTATVTVVVTDGPVENMAPEASFLADPVSGAAPLTVSFDASSASDPDGDIVSYVWDFGDGDVGNGVTVSHTYDTVGSFTAGLTVTDDDGAPSSVTSVITVTTSSPQGPTASFVADPLTGGAPLTVAFDASASIDVDGDIVAYVWEFGDGAFGFGETVVHTYETAGTYVARLVVTDSEGLNDEATVEITVTGANAPPVASLVADHDSGVAPLTVVFDASASADSDGEIVEYVWDFGNDSGGLGPMVNTTYDEPGEYLVTLTVTDDAGAQGSAETTITVVPPQANQPPNASMTVTPLTGVVPLLVHFDASSSSDADGSIVSYVWNYGTGAGGFGPKTNFTYTNPGIYLVTLTVTDDDGATDVATTQVRVRTPAPFRRGDTNNDLAFDISDAIKVLGFLFIGGPGLAISCEKAADIDDSGRIDLTDPIYLLGYIFLGGPAPPPPFVECGLDPTSDSLTCEDFPECEL